MKLLSQGRLVAAGALAGFLCLAAAAVVPTNEAGIALAVVSVVCFGAAVGALRDMQARFQKALDELQARQTTKA